MSMVSLSFFPSFSNAFYFEYLFIGSLANEPSLLSDFGLACFLGLYEEVKKVCLIFIFSKLRLWNYSSVDGRVRNGS